MSDPAETGGEGGRGQALTDKENLNTLALCHFVLGGVIALFSCLFIFHIAFGLTLAHHPGAFTPPAPAPVTPALGFPPAMGYFFAAAGAVAVLGGWTLGGLTAYAGQCIRRRKGYVFVLVIAGVNCAFVMPLGTALSVFTFLVLLRPTVKRLFSG